MANPVQAMPPPFEMKEVAASQTDEVLGDAGKAYDYLAFVTIVPETTSPGAVSVKDGSGAARTIFEGGATSVASLVPFPVPIASFSKLGAWKITTGADVHVEAVGMFTDGDD